VSARLASLPLLRLRGEAVSTTSREAITAAALAAAVASLLVTLGLAGGDAPAHLYRTLLVREGVLFWDNLWYGGHYPLASYSSLYYLPASLVGDLPLVVAAVVVSAALFASIVIGEWGNVAVWPSRVFGLLVSGPVFTGTYSYALGLAALLACVRALQTGRTMLAVAAAALTLGFSPLAFVFLCLVLGAVAFARRRLTRRVLAVGTGVTLLATLQLAALFLFPSQGVYPFRSVELLAVLLACSLGAALAVRAPRGDLLAALFALWGIASLVAFAVPSPLGENLTRLRSFVFPLVLLAALLARYRPRWLALAALAFAVGYNAAPYVGAAADRSGVRGAVKSFWAPAIEYVQRRSGPQYRVEVVPTRDHWEAYWLPRSGLALARGWYRQLDVARNPVLYQRPLTAHKYRAWLRRMAVRFVVLPHTKLGEKGESFEAQLLRFGRSGLVQVFASSEATIYELPRPVPILTGPRGGRLTALGHSRVEGHVVSPGTYLLRVRYSRYWTIVAGDACVEPSPGGMTRLRMRRPGSFALAVPETTTEIVRAIAGGSESGCRMLRPASGSRAGQR
jgi:hypothetical protein